MLTTDEERFRAGQDLQQAVYALIVAGNGGADQKDRCTEAAIRNMRLAARDLGFELVEKDDGK